ncbi:MAG: FlgD immunoglobulin-like domain containing protein, partial [Elusimicrobiota bacterium]|nr:FlgD immunoglobulin-like domain containing protein [Elusimicrobiota bacterium]
FTVKGTPPRITVETPSGEQSGLVTINYRLIDDDNKPAPYNYCSIVVEYRDPNNVWKPATRFVASEPTENLKASFPTGTLHSFIWDSSVDLPNKDISTAIRITPSDEDGTGSSGQTGSFQVDNIQATKLVFVTAAGELLTSATSQEIIVQAQDNAGNKDVDANIILNLESTSGNYAFVSSTANVNIGDTVSMSLGEARFRYRDEIPGNPTITVSYSGLQQANQSWWITRSVSVFLSSVTVIDNTQKYTESVVGSTINVIVTLKDTGDSPVANKTVSIAATGSNNYITQPVDKTNASGQAFATIWSPKAELKYISANNVSDNQTILSTASIRFVPGTDNIAGKPSATISTIEASGTEFMVGSSVTITVTLKDQYGNIISSDIPSQILLIGQKQVNISVDSKPPEDILVYQSSFTDINGQVKAIYIGNVSGTRIFSATNVDFNVTLISTVTVIFKTQEQIYAGDTSSPIVTAVWPTKDSEVTTAISSITVTVIEDGSSGLNVTSTTIKLVGPTGAEITGTKSGPYLVSGTTNSYTITLSFTEQSTNGSYQITVIPIDNAGNTGATWISTFTINIKTAEQVFKESTYSYPNPSNTGRVIFNYSLLNNVDKVTLKIYNIMGELIREDQLDTSAGADKKYPWNADNQDGTKVGSGVYICKFIVEDNGRRYISTKKQIVIKSK